jgi:hypothetical protein
MSYGGTEHSGRGAYRIHMNPLIIAGHSRKLIDARLIDSEPVARANGGTDERLELC